MLRQYTPFEYVSFFRPISCVNLQNTIIKYIYSAGAKYCDLCLTEKTIIMLADKKSCLNIRSEILRKCPHISKFTLGMVKP